MFFPAVHIAGYAHKALQRAQFKGRRDVARRALRRDQRPDHAFAGGPACAGEIQQVGTRVQVQRVQSRGLHQLLRALQARGKFRILNGLGTCAQVLQACQFFGGV